MSKRKPSWVVCASARSGNLGNLGTDGETWGQTGGNLGTDGTFSVSFPAHGTTGASHCGRRGASCYPTW